MEVNTFNQISNLDKFFTYKEKQIILHALTIYLEKLEFVLKNKKYYDVSGDAFFFSKQDYNDVFSLRDKISIIEYKY